VLPRKLVRFEFSPIRIFANSNFRQFEILENAEILTDCNTLHISDGIFPG
jgi:hypothetical protein